MDYRFEHARAQRLADLAGVQRDLELTVEACEEFLGNPVVGSEKAIIISRSLATFAIVTYFRTMATAVRSGISAAHLDELPSQLMDRHRCLKSVRDKFIVHSANHFEENFVEVGVESTESGVKLATLGTSHSRYATFACSDIADLKGLAEALIEVMDKEYEAEFDRVWDYLESLTPEELDSSLNAPVDSGWKSVHAQRKRFPNP